MRHLACAAVIGFSTAAILAPVSPSHAASADPTGYWMKPDAERESKIHVFKCGSKKTNLCAKIAWIKDPLDSKGKPLHDVRNENPSLRGRPIKGLAIFSQLAPSAPSVWTGKIYNPEDGHTYSATLTVVSRKQILLKGCKAWLLCGERMWYRTSPPPAEIIPAPADGTQQIEASVTPPMTPAAPARSEAAVAAAPAAPSAEVPVAKASIDGAAAQQEMQAMTAPQLPAESSPAEAALLAPAAAAEPVTPAPAAQEIAAPVAPPAEIDAGHGYGFLDVAAEPEATAPQSGENVSNMMLMAKPITKESAAPSTAQPAAKKASTAPAVEPAPLPAPAAKPKAQPKPVATAAVKPAAPQATVKPAAAQAAKAVATPAAKPLATPAAKPVATAATKPETLTKPADQAALPPQEGDEVVAETGESVPAETADATLAEPVPLTRRERRLLRKQQRALEEGANLPWLR